MNYLDELEKIRKKILIKTIITFLFMTLYFIVLLIASNSFLVYFISVIAFTILVTEIITRKNRKEYKKIYKENVVLEVLKEYFTDLKYSLRVGIAESVISSTKMMMTGDKFRSNDRISAKYKDINLLYSDLHIQLEGKGRNDDSPPLTIFKGQWFVFDFNKTFKSNIQVSEKFFMAVISGKVEGYKRIKVEDVDFNRKFKVYAENELEAFYVLTPNTIEKIKTLNKKLRGKLLFCLINNKMHIGLDNRRDLFEPNVYRKINLNKEKERILKEIKIITDFVDVLDLDNDLFKGRN